MLTENDKNMNPFGTADIERKPNGNGGNRIYIRDHHDMNVFGMPKTEPQPQVSECWSLEQKVLTACSNAPAEVPVSISYLAKIKFDLLMSKYPSIEWLAYFRGTKTNTSVTITDIVVPKQTVTSVRVDNIDHTSYDGAIIGVIHSHHGMGNGFSGTDDEYINQNHDISLCISHGGINGQFRWKSECGGVKYVNTKVTLNTDVEVNFNTGDFLRECAELITPYRPSYPVGRDFVRRDPDDVNSVLEDSLRADEDDDMCPECLLDFDNCVCEFCDVCGEDVVECGCDEGPTVRNMIFDLDKHKDKMILHRRSLQAKMLEDPNLRTVWVDDEDDDSWDTGSESVDSEPEEVTPEKITALGDELSKELSQL